MGAGAKEDYGGAKPPGPPLVLLLGISSLVWQEREGGLARCSSGPVVPASKLGSGDLNLSPPVARAWGLTSAVSGTGRWAAEQRLEAVASWGLWEAPRQCRALGGHGGALAHQTG